MRIMNCIAIFQVAGFNARFQNPDGIAAVCSIQVATKTIDWCVSWGQGIFLSPILNTRNQRKVTHRCPLCQRSCQNSS
ncbi:hypothetical protein NP493_2539g00000 [Ridgeia piscesae]|uniref:Uncharacterized protein n=1 Tax=Ridgeia piscesae TaxID=27915 RepID=A0AAD9JFR4_RIDPI|nr:hypothetical protein NP493_2539g00000 [Ridgeia piscesae]